MSAGGDRQMKTRRYDLDWLRGLTVMGLVFFHSAMFFNDSWWHLKNAQLSLGFSIFTGIINQWQMPLLFVISGAGTWFALTFRGGGEYALERVQRLLVPLVFGSLVIVPPQVYLERLKNGQFYGSYLSFWPRHMWDGGTYPQGNASWHHLWFLAYLFVFSLLALPLFLQLKSERGSQALARLGGCCERRGGIFALALLPMVLEVALRPTWNGLQSLIGDWANLCTYLTFFVYGFVLFSHEAFGRALARYGKAALGLALVTMVAGAAIALTGHEPGPGYSLGGSLWLALRTFNTWCWLVAFFSLAQGYLNYTSRIQPYVNEAVLPVYVLHQTVIVIIGYFVIQWQAAPFPKFAVISLCSLAATLGVYDLLVRRMRVVRFLFGMRVGKRAA